MVVDGDAISGGRLVIRAMEPGDLDAADRVMRVAFGTFVGATEPSEMFGDMEYVRPRFAAAPDWAFVAELDGEVVGSNFATRWGSFASFGPLSIRPDLWDRGITVALMQPIVELFERWEVRQAGLHTFAQSAKHVGLYQRFDFWPQFLTAIMTKSIPPAVRDTEFLRFSELAVETRDVVLTECAALTNAIFEGLDVRHEILSVDNQQLGDTVIVHDGHGVAGLAVCHCGAGEAGSASCYIKFAAHDLEQMPGPCSSASLRWPSGLQLIEGSVLHPGCVRHRRPSLTTRNERPQPRAEGDSSLINSWPICGDLLQKAVAT